MSLNPNTTLILIRNDKETKKQQATPIRKIITSEEINARSVPAVYYI